MNPDARTSDKLQRSKNTVSSVPLGLNQILSASVTLPSGYNGSFTITTLPDEPSLSLWNFKRSIFVDTEDHEHRAARGELLTDSQLQCTIDDEHVDWAESDDVNNVTVYTIHIYNWSPDEHTYYLRFKAYTQAGVTGSTI